MDDETNQETDADLEVDETSAGDNSDDSQSDQNVGENTQPDIKQDEVKQEKKPKIWQVVRGIQKSIEDLKTSKQPQTEAKEQKDLSSKDLYSLMEHKVLSKHIDEVVKASKILGKSISETLEDGFVQARLKTLVEEEQTANATNTGGSKRTIAKITDEQIVQRYMEGKDVDPEALALARMNLRKKK